MGRLADGPTMAWQDEHRERVEGMASDIRDAQTHSILHRAEILSSTTCGCFYCCRTFRPDEVREWVDDNAAGIGQTALCPNCGMDSVIGDQAGYALSDDFLRRMHACWF